MSNTMVMHPIVSVLIKAEEILGKPLNWIAHHDLQKNFLNKFYINHGDISKFNHEEIRSWLSTKVEELNDILNQEGFNIKLEKFHKHEFGIVSILDVLVEWLYAGSKSIIEFKKTDYPAVYMNKGFTVEIKSKYHHPILKLETKSGDVVFLTLADQELSGFELIKKIDNIIQSDSSYDKYDDALFPMVSLDQKPDIRWLLYLKTFSPAQKQEYFISQAQQQTKFKMNHIGAHVKSAVAISMRMTSSYVEKRTLVIDKPFYLWMSRPGVNNPILYAYINQEDWKDPGNLNL